ncbi:ceramidase domain-containing protein [Nitrospina sp. 32_T5]|uniref:ceramidase domain-containing protein n=1 Tax=unclassified Nitrospina TaxID=2638683 RepID=UPI003F9A77CD
MSHKTRVGILLAMTVLSVLAVFSFPPVGQDPDYHSFADTYSLLGIPNFGNVVSNLAFVVVGLMGLTVLRKVSQRPGSFYLPQEKWMFFIAFVGTILIGFGSMYYHWSPGDSTLLWDRLPMTVVFMSVFAGVLADRMGPRVGLAALGPLVFVGLASVLYWDHTETLGQGDLRLYVLVQFLPMILIPLLFLLFPPRYGGSVAFVKILAWYVVAKFFEHFDVWIYSGTAGIMSGHTMKHLLAGAALFFLIPYLQERRRVEGAGT